MLITSIPQYIQGLTNAKLDLTTTDVTVLYTHLVMQILMRLLLVLS